MYQRLPADETKEECSSFRHQTAQLAIRTLLAREGGVTAREMSWPPAAKDGGHLNLR